MDKEKYMSINGFLYEEGDHILVKDENGKINKYPRPKFENGEIAVRKKANDFVIMEPLGYYERRDGWVYSINYIDRAGNGGGSSSAWEESLFSKPESLVDMLFAKRIHLKRERAEISVRAKEIDRELLEVENCLRLKYDLKTGKERGETL
ncbi:MAG: hypothetical protein LBS88_04165 [Tannerellaceae bacterium]|jgi:hypothetical protein|nr:hypothetical protein [Tannerellaceae bacterium]